MSAGVLRSDESITMNKPAGESVYQNHHSPLRLQDAERMWTRGFDTAARLCKELNCRKSKGGVRRAKPLQQRTGLRAFTCSVTEHSRN